MSPLSGNQGWRRVLLATALVSSASLVISPILYLRTQSALDQIHQNRIELCLESNQRHDLTIRTLDREIAQLPPGRRADAEKHRAGTVALLEAIAPKRDCEQSLARP